MSERVICLDGEGVVWRGGTPVPGASDAVQSMRNAGYRVIILTNNASRSSAQYVERLTKGGFNGFTERDVVTSAVAVSRYLTAQGFANSERKIFVIGTAGFCKEMREVGMTVLTASDFDGVDIHEAELDITVGAVVIGSSEEFNYRHVTIATRFVIENDALLISSNEDGSYPISRKVLVPGPYALAMCVATAAARDPIVLGKPNAEVFKTIAGLDSVPRDRIWMIGDRLNTDIRFAKNVGIKSILVLTGVSHAEDVQMIDPAYRPDFIAVDVMEALKVIQNND
jgi:4-nitrophenyl phosphatase